jgi:hypothetical protein
MRDEDDDHYKVEISFGINKIVDLFRVRFNSRGKTLKVVDIYGDDDIKVVAIQTDKGEFICAIRKMKTKSRIVIMDMKTRETLGMIEV